jgi:hypothetical protein
MIFNMTTNHDSLFFQNVPSRFAVGDDAAQQRLLREYGAIFVARGGVIAPHKIVFRDEEDVADFQSGLNIASEKIGGFSMELQAAAMEGLLRSISEAKDLNLKITPRGADSARRNYDDTVGLWRSRVEPALIHWVAQGRMTTGTADMIRSLPPFDQLPEVFALEAEGIYFAKDLSKSIIYSVAPPGASQHLSLLAFDVAEFDDRQVRGILARNFWYQTVVSDLPHFTFLGVGENELPSLGLRHETSGDREFWVPDI